MRVSSRLEGPDGEMRGKTAPGHIKRGRTVPQKVHNLDPDRRVNREELENVLQTVLSSYEERGWNAEQGDCSVERAKAYYVHKKAPLRQRLNPFTLPETPHEYCLGVVVPDELDEVEEISIYNDSSGGYRRRGKIPEEMVTDFTSEIVEALED